MTSEHVHLSLEYIIIFKYSLNIQLLREGQIISYGVNGIIRRIERLLLIIVVIMQIAKLKCLVNFIASYS